jgi:hypothetical protein
MKRPFVIAVLASLLVLTVSYAERSLVQVYQPTSLLGTEGEDDPLGTGEWMAATIVSRPVIIGGAFPESPVYAVSLPHRIAGATEGFPQESNLIVIVGGKVHAEWGESEHRIIADFSKATVPENLGVTLIQVMKLTAVCLQKTLGAEQETPIRITWKAPPGDTLEGAGLPSEIDEADAETGSEESTTSPDSKAKGKPVDTRVPPQ